MKSKNARQNDAFLRNSYYSMSNWDIPLIYNQECDIDDIELIGFHNTKPKDTKNTNKTVHFFIDDYKFERLWNNTDRYIERLSQYKTVMTPDFSMYSDMPLSMQIYNTFRNRWCGAYWQSNGITVIPTVNWSTEKSFEFWKMNTFHQKVCSSRLH